jgi:hypothetical protein
VRAAVLQLGVVSAAQWCRRTVGESVAAQAGVPPVADAEGRAANMKSARKLPCWFSTKVGGLRPNRCRETRQVHRRQPPGWWVGPCVISSLPEFFAAMRFQ